MGSPDEQLDATLLSGAQPVTITRAAGEEFACWFGGVAELDGMSTHPYSLNPDAGVLGDVPRFGSSPAVQE